MDSGTDGAMVEPTGIDGLDAILFGGLPARAVYLVQGAPGTGKTTLGLQFLLEGARRGERTLYVTLSQSEDDLRRIAQSHGFALDGIAIRELLSLSHGEADRQSVLQTSEAELTGVIRGVRRALDEIAPQRVVFDSLLELRLLTRNLLAYHRELLTIRNLMVAGGVTGLILDYDDPQIGDRQMEGLAHGVIRLERQLPQYGTALRRLTFSKLRGRAFVDGYHDLTIRPGGLVVYPRIVPELAEDSVTGVMVRSGLDALDQMLGGGLEAGTTCLVVGQSGVGKSTLGTLYARSAAEGGMPSALFLFEERPQVFRRRSRGLGLGVDALEDEGLLQIHHFNGAETTPGEFVRAVVRAVEGDGARVVVIDSLTGYLGALPNAADLVTQLQSLLQYLSRRDVLTVVIVAQHGLLGGSSDVDFDTSYLADSIILLRQYEAGSSIRRSITVVKKRHGPHERVIRELVIGDGGIDVRDLPEGGQRHVASTPLLGN